MMLAPRYKSLMKRYACLLGVGMAFQFLIGEIDPSFLVYPWGLVIAINYLYVLIFLFVRSDQWKWVKCEYDRPASIASLSSLLLLTLLFGLIRQDNSTDGLMGWLGFTHMQTSWIFNIFLFQFMTMIGLKALDDICHWKKRRITKMVMHVSLFIILLAAIFGSGDKLRVRVMATEGHPVQIGLTHQGEQVVLPFILTLKDFSVEEYPTEEKGTMVIKQFHSELEVKQGEKMEVVNISVNHPAQIGSWRIYQSGYDTARGKMSTLSILECVRDGWYEVIHLALWLILAGGVWMFLQGWSYSKQKKEGKE